MKWPETKERFRSPAGSRDADPPHSGREERVSFEGQYYKTEKATIYDRPDTPVPIYVAAAGALVAVTPAAPPRDSSAQAARSLRLYTKTLLPKVAEGLAASEEAVAQSYDRMIEVKVSFDTDKAACVRGHAPLGGAGADTGGKE
jgi:coenzyme F420-dependent glucose-6-phosphate dehydrogenase